MLLKKDRIISVIFLVVAIVFLAFVDDIKMPSNLTEPGPRMMPYLSITLMAICCFGVLFESFNNKDKQEKPFLSNEGWKRLVVILAVLVLYSIGLMYVGFLVATPFMAYALIHMLSGEDKISIATGVIVSIAITAMIYLLFSFGFNVTLPPGILLD